MLEAPVLEETSAEGVAPRKERDGSLNSVRAVIPERCYQPSATRSVMAVIQSVSLWLAPVVVLVFTDAAWWSIGLIALIGLGTAGLFVIGHDASHGALFDSAAANRHVARWCMIPSIHNEAAWDLGHNRLHHGFTSRLGFDFVWHPVTPAEYGALGRFARLRHRLEWSWVGSGMYYGREVWWNKMMRYRPEGKRAAAYRSDNRFLLATIAGLAVGLATAGAFQGGAGRAIWLVLAVVVVPFLVFCQVIGWTVYVHHIAPDLLWWPRREWSQFKGQMQSTTVIDLPAWINRTWFHDIFVHVPHHVDPRIAFYHLREATAAIEHEVPGVVRHERFNPRSFFRSTRACKLFDAEQRRWVKYSSIG